MIPKSDNFLENITNIYNYSLVIPNTNVRKITPEKAQEAIVRSLYEFFLSIIYISICLNTNYQ